MKTYVTERGIEIGITPIPLLLEQIREAHPRPDVPTYAEKTASGAERQVEMVAAEMEAAKEHNPEWYAQHAEMWEAYQTEAAKSESALNDKILNAILLRAVQVDIPEDGDWLEEQAFLGLEVPENRLERRIHYLKTEVIGGTRDIIRLTLMASGADVTEEVLARAEASFRGVLQGAALGELEHQAGTVEGEPETDAAPGGS